MTTTDGQLALLHVTLEDSPADTDPCCSHARHCHGWSRQSHWSVSSVKPTTACVPAAQTGDLRRHAPGRSAAKAGTHRSAVTVPQKPAGDHHPKGLALNRTPWTSLTWSQQGSTLHVRNDSPYVVRLAQDLRLLPGDGKAMLPRTYVLPGETLSVQASGGPATKVRLQPATVYGFAAAAYEARLSDDKKGSRPARALQRSAFRENILSYSARRVPDNPLALTSRDAGWPCLLRASWAEARPASTPPPAQRADQSWPN